jgi:4-hydroxy-tetrahydrodipicolinate synthase
MKNTVFTGAATAIVTPMNKKGEIDYEAFKRLIEWQIAEGIDAIVSVGTTGEGSTLSDKEHRDAMKFCVDTVAGRVPVIAGTGSNDIAYAIDLTRFACEIGADAMLLVTPYYNKATQRGLIESFTAIANASTKPCILYNVPSRTGCNLTPASCAELAKHPNIVGVKEASGNVSQIAEIARLCGEDFAIYSGNDDQIIPVLSLGGKGVISVLSNVLPKETSLMCKKYFEGDVKGALAMQLRYLPLINQLFCEVNPIPVKAATAAMGYGENVLRLPLTSMEKANEEKLLALMKEQGIALQ